LRANTSASIEVSLQIASDGAPAFFSKSKRRADLPRDACLNHPAMANNQLAARRLTLPSASVVSFLSVAFSSSSVFCNRLAQSARPSCFAHATADRSVVPANRGNLRREQVMLRQMERSRRMERRATN